MSQSKKKRASPGSAEKVTTSQALDSKPSGRWSAYIIVSVVIALILIIVGIFYYQSYVAPFRRSIITVDNINIRMDYFLMRARLAGAQPMAMLEALTDEQIVKLAAPQFGIAVSEEDINQELRRAAGGASGNITESEFKEWFRQQLNEMGIPAAQYQEIVATTLLASRLNEYLAQRLPTVAEQVHLYALTVNDEDEVEKLAQQWAEGKDLTKLTREIWQAKESQGKVEDLGWLPRGILSGGLDNVAFSLNPGDISEPLPTENGYYLFMVSEKAAARQLDENSLQMLKDRALNTWLTTERSRYQIKYNFNSEINAWLSWQLAKNKPASTGQEPTQQ